MKIFTMSKIWAFAFTILLFFGCETHENNQVEDPNNQETEDVISNDLEIKEIARELLQISAWNTEAEPDPEGLKNSEKKIFRILHFQRQEVCNDIARYSFELQVGSDKWDRIRIHRVVKEKRPFYPVKSKKSVFLQHGDAIGFVSSFLPGVIIGTSSNNFGLAAFLAENNVDVWGIDQAWSLVPAETDSFVFMEDWGLQKQINDLKTAMTIARFTRLLSGNGNDKFILSGYSSGVITSFGLLNEETQLPAFRQQVKAYIPIDMPVKAQDEALKSIFINDYNNHTARLEAGVFQESYPFHLLATLATTNPDGASPVIPGLTNFQVLPVVFAAPGKPGIPFHHYAGIWENDLPVGFQFTNIDKVIDFAFSTAHHQPLQFMADMSAVVSGEEEVIFDDYLSEIRAPILYIGAAGGMGYYLDYSKSLLPNSNVTDLMISLYPPEQAVADYGHIDLLQADNAEEFVWGPMLDWINLQ